MAELFTLELSDMLHTIDFLDGTTYELANGGFDIGMPRSTRTLSEVRPGFWRLISSTQQYREATIRFAVKGATRTAIIDAINLVERTIASIEGDYIYKEGPRGQLKYAWEGAASPTWFEVFAGEIGLPSDIMSVEKLHAIDGDGYYVPEVVVKVYLSPVGYGIALNGTKRGIQLNLWNDDNPTPSTACGIQNGADGASNWVQIDATELPGATPWIPQIAISQQSAGVYDKIYMSRTVKRVDTADLNEWPDTINDVDSSATWIMGDFPAYVFPSPTPTYNTGASNNYYLSVPFANTVGVEHGEDILVTGNWTHWHGTFFVLMEVFNAIPLGASKYFALSFFYEDSTIEGLNWVQGIQRSAGGTIPLGTKQLPIGGQSTNILRYASGMMSLFQGRDDVNTGHTYDLDYFIALPIDEGFRVLKVLNNVLYQGSTSHAWFVDDPFQGLEYIAEGSDTWTASMSVFTQHLYGIGQPLRLSSGVDQRIYFHAQEVATRSSYVKTKDFDVMIWAVPTFGTLAY